MSLKIGQVLVRIRDDKEFVVAGATSYSLAVNDAIQTYRLLSMTGSTEEVYTDDMQLEFGRAGFRLPAEAMQVGTPILPEP